MSQEFQQLKNMPGYFYPRGKKNCIYWKVRLPNEDHIKQRRLIDENGKGITNQRIAKQIAQRMWREAETKTGKTEYTIADLIDKFCAEIDEMYEGGSNRNDAIRKQLDSLREFPKKAKPYSTLSIDEFDSAMFRKYIRSITKSKQWASKSLRDRIATIKRMFAFGVEEKLVTEERLHSFKDIQLTTKNREIKKPRKICSFDIKWLEVLLPYLPSQVTRVMAIFQYLQSLRSTEMCCLKPGDVDRSEKIWVWKPEIYKGQHEEDYDERIIYILKPAQEIIAKYMDREPNQYCFSPKESDAEIRARRSANRKTPMSCGNKPGSNVKKKPKTKPKDKYTENSWYQVFNRAVKQARKDHKNMPYFSPHGLRHTGATEIVKHGSLKEVMKFLGHKRIETTLKYAELSKQEALNLAERASNVPAFASFSKVTTENKHQ